MNYYNVGKTDDSPEAMNLFFNAKNKADILLKMIRVSNIIS
jgi:hypothetical protein